MVQLINLIMQDYNVYSGNTPSETKRGLLCTEAAVEIVSVLASKNIFTILKLTGTVEVCFRG